MYTLVPCSLAILVLGECFLWAKYEGLCGFLKAREICGDDDKVANRSMASSVLLLRWFVFSNMFVFCMLYGKLVRGWRWRDGRWRDGALAGWAGQRSGGLHTFRFYTMLTIITVTEIIAAI